MPKKPAAAKKLSTLKHYTIVRQLSEAEVAAREEREKAPIPRQLVDDERCRLYGVMDTLDALGRMAELCLNADATEDDYEALAIMTRGIAGEARAKVASIANALDKMT